MKQEQPYDSEGQPLEANARPIAKRSGEIWKPSKECTYTMKPARAEPLFKSEHVMEYLDSGVTQARRIQQMKLVSKQRKSREQVET